MRRRTFLRALAGGTVAALLGVQPRQLGEAATTRPDVWCVWRPARHLMAGYHPPAFFRPRAAPLFDAVMARVNP